MNYLKSDTRNGAPDIDGRPRRQEREAATETRQQIKGHQGSSEEAGGEAKWDNE
jgi:hypothetical protein